MYFWKRAPITRPATYDPEHHMALYRLKILLLFFFLPRTEINRKSKEMGIKP